MLAFSPALTPNASAVKETTHIKRIGEYDIEIDNRTTYTLSAYQSKVIVCVMAKERTWQESSAKDYTIARYG